MKPDPTTFADPHVWATWIAGRSKPFKTHSSLALCKNAISSFCHRDVLPRNAWVYRWDDEACVWRQVFFLPEGSEKGDSELYKTVATKVVRGPSKKAIEKTIASIMNATEESE